MKLIKKLICRILPLRNRIVFESNPEFSCNALPVYEEMVRRGARKKYEIYWLVEDKSKYNNDLSGNKYLNYTEVGLSKLKKKYILATSKVLIFTNRFLHKCKKDQLVINLMHGSPMKRAPGYFEGDTCDFVVSSSAFFCNSINECLGVPKKKIIALGYPRNDVLGGVYNTKLKLGIPDNNKLIVWMPTFRKNKSSGVEYGAVTNLGVPILDTKEKFVEINKSLRDNLVYLIIKLHPAEDISGISLCSYSNIYFISDRELEEKGLTSYEMLADSDALLTDYSSVYFDYLLLDRPIGLVTDNLDEFANKIGFYCGDYKTNIKGKYIENLNEFIEFIGEISYGIDTEKATREWAINKYCEYRDFNSTKRVVDFIEGELKLIK